MFNTKEKKERSLGIKLFLKPHRCSSIKCALTRNPKRPGAQGMARRRAQSEYGLQLNEKQKVRAIYGLREEQFSNIFSRASKSKAETGPKLLELLELRLDNAVFRSGLAASRSIARQLVSHGHILVNNRKTTVPSYVLKVNDIIKARENSRGIGQ